MGAKPISSYVSANCDPAGTAKPVAFMANAAAEIAFATIARAVGESALGATNSGDCIAQVIKVADGPYSHGQTPVSGRGGSVKRRADSGRRCR